jgi:multiple sugar transport system substrate-binding protein
MNRNKGLSQTQWIAVILAIIIVIAVVVAAWYLYLQPVGPGKLTVISLWSGAEEDNFLQVLGNFTENTGIENRHIGYSTQELKITIPTQLAANASIFDLAIAPWPADILDWAEKGYLTEVTDLIDASKYPSGFINAVKDANGKIWAIPFKASAKPGFWYRKSIWQTNGWTVPTETTTYTEFKTLLATIKANGAAITGFKEPIASGDGVGWPLSDTTEAFIMGLGGYQLQEELIEGPSTRNWTDPEVENVFSNLTELLDMGYFGTPELAWTDPLPDLWDGKYAMYFQGSFITGQTDYIQNVSDFDFFPFPGWSGETDGAAGSVDYVILPKFTQNMDDAKNLLEYLAGTESQEIMVKLGGFLATNTDVPDTAYTTLDKKVLDFISQPSVHIVADLDDAIGGVFQTTFWSQLKLLWTDQPTRDNLDDFLQTLQDFAG